MVSVMAVEAVMATRSCRYGRVMAVETVMAARSCRYGRRYDRPPYRYGRRYGRPIRYGRPPYRYDRRYGRPHRYGRLGHIDMAGHSDMAKPMQTIWTPNFMAGGKNSDFVKTASAMDASALWPVVCKRYGRQIDMAVFNLCTHLRYGRFEKSLWAAELKGGRKTSIPRY